jgi:hypothetical protein
MTSIAIQNLKSLHIHMHEQPSGLIAGELLTLGTFVDAPGTKVLSKDGNTVFDPRTGLTWEQSGSDKAMTYDEVDAYIAKLNAEKFAGIDTWRQPDDQELSAIVDRSRRNPAIDPIFSCKPEWYWTSKPLMNTDGASSSGYVWIVSFSLGNVHHYGHRSSKAFVRAVSGPSPAGQ